MQRLQHHSSVPFISKVKRASERKHKRPLKREETADLKGFAYYIGHFHNEKTNIAFKARQFFTKKKANLQNLTNVQVVGCYW